MMKKYIYLLSSCMFLLNIGSPCFAEEIETKNCATILNGFLNKNRVTRDIEGLSVMSFLPKNDAEYSSVFQENATTSLLGHTTKADDYLKKSFIDSRIEKTARNLEDFEKSIEASKSQYVTIIGHNSNGKFYFPSGVSTELTTLDSICLKVDVTCIFLSCSAKNYINKKSIGASSPITAKEAALIAKKLNDKLSEFAGIYVDRAIIVGFLQEIVSDLEKQVRRELKVIDISEKAGGVTIVGGIGYGVTTLTSEN